MMDGFEQFLMTAGHSNVVPVVKTMAADLLTPLSVYLKLSKGARNSFLLESVEGGESLARFSFIGAEPESIVRGHDKQVEILTGSGRRIESTGMFDYLRTHFRALKLADDDRLPSFTGGAIGFLRFDCAKWFEPSLRAPARPVDPEQAAFMFFRSIVAFDHVRQTINIVTLVFTDDGGDADDLERLYRAAAANNDRMRCVLENSEICVPPPDRDLEVNELSSNWTQDRFELAVTEITELINAGECYQVVLSQRFSRRTGANAVGIYRAVRSLNPSPYMFLLNFDGKAIVGASPEMLVRCRQRRLEYRPIAGTRPRGKTIAEDTALADEMRRDRKEVAEHLMLVDLGRNDLGRVAEFGTVKVEEMMSVEKYSHVQHLVSSVTANLRPDLDRFDALASCFPAGTVSGAPKVRAIEILNRLEPTNRGIYSGAIGYFDYSGNMDTCIAIRTLVLENGEATVQAGAGIVADSVPKLEFEETVNKAKAMLKAIEIAEGSR